MVLALRVHKPKTVFIHRIPPMLGGGLEFVKHQYARSSRAALRACRSEEALLPCMACGSALDQHGAGLALE
jgi:hypothetical protein